MRIIVTCSGREWDLAYRRDFCVAGKVLFLAIAMVTMVFTLKLIKQFINVHTFICEGLYLCVFYLTIKCKLSKKEK